MSNVLAIDNFERMHGLPNNTTWLRSVYLLYNNFTSSSYAQSATVGGKSALTLAGRLASTANWGVGTKLPNDFDTYTLGLRVLGTPAASQGSASLAILANYTGTEYDTVLAIELTPTGATVHYKDTDGAKTQSVAFAYTNNDTYIDFSFVKQSTVVNEMSRFTLMVNNFPAFNADIFNNAGTDLALMFAGVFSTVPDESDGYLRHSTISSLSPTNLGYSISDMYVSRGGKRFGKPEVASTLINSLVTDLGSNSEDTVQEVFNEGPQDWTFAQGTGTTTATFNTVAGEVSQVRSIAQSQQEDQLVPVSLEYGTTVEASISGTPSAIQVITEGSPNQAVLEIGNE